MIDSIIKADNITKYYGNFKAVDNIGFRISRGEVYSFLGANGAGKSTIIRLLIGLNSFGENDTGNILVDNISVRENPKDIKKIIGYVPEEKVLIEDLTGEEYVDFIAKLYKCNDVMLLNRKKYLFDLFKLNDKKKHLIRYYSNGMKKKILVIASLIHNPKILVVDEPFAALDPESIYILKKVFVELSTKGCTVILSSHNLKIIEDICNRVIILNYGKVLFEGDKLNLFEKCNTDNFEDSYIHLIKGVEEVKKVDDFIHNIPYSI